jgi:hypothetical protein
MLKGGLEVKDAGPIGGEEDFSNNCKCYSLEEMKEVE